MFIIPALIIYITVRIWESLENAQKIREDISKIYFNSLYNETNTECYSESPIEMIEELNKET